MRRIEKIAGVEYITYYLKVITVPPLTLVDNTGSEFTPNNTDNIQTDINSTTQQDPRVTLPAHSFFTLTLNIESNEFKEFYKATTGGVLDNAYISEFGIVLGQDIAGINSTDTKTYTEVKNAELFSKVVHAPSYMDQEVNGKRITYTIFS